MIFCITVFTKYNLSFTCTPFKTPLNHTVETYVVFVRGMLVHWIRINKVFASRFG